MKHIFVSIVVLLVLFVGCSNPSNPPPDSNNPPAPQTSKPMQVYQSDRVTQYTGSDNVFMRFRNDFSDPWTEIITATITNGQLVITYNPVPSQFLTDDFSDSLGSSASSNTADMLVASINNLRKEGNFLNFMNTTDTKNIRIVYFNKAGSLTRDGHVYNVRQGWNFINLWPGEEGISQDPTYWYPEYFFWWQN